VSTTDLTLTGSVPLDVAGTLMSLVGAAYPSTTVSSDRNGLTFHIEDGDRSTDPDLFTKAAALRQEADEFSLETYLQHIGGGEVAVTLPQILAATLVGLAEGMFEEHSPDVNYLETVVSSTTHPEQRWAVIVSRSAGRTPHELRTKAEARADAAEAEVARLKALLEAA
jgi:hypothetical protein